MDVLKRNWKWLAAGAVGVGIVAYAYNADAADLGSSCCSDLEERIAELEATTARKGNRKVSVVVAGQINKALFYYDADDFGLGSNTHVIENSASETFVSISGKADIRDGWSAGYTLELGQGATGIDVNLALTGPTGGVGTDNDIYTRQSYAYLKSDALGAVSIGLQSMATDDLSHVSVARTTAASKRLTAQPIGSLRVSALGIDLLDVPLEPFNGRKANAVKYTSPVLGGFSVSAAWSSDDDSWDAALRYAGEFGGFQVVGALGYYDDKTNDIAESLGALIALPDIGSTTISAHGGIKHVASGLFVQGSWARLDFDEPISFETDAWHAQAGLEVRFFQVGQTTLWGEYSEWDDLAGLKFYGLGINQQLGEAVDLYALARRYDIDDAGGQIDTITTGLRLRF